PRPGRPPAIRRPIAPRRPRPMPRRAPASPKPGAPRSHAPLACDQPSPTPPSPTPRPALPGSPHSIAEMGAMLPAGQAPALIDPTYANSSRQGTQLPRIDTRHAGGEPARGWAGGVCNGGNVMRLVVPALGLTALALVGFMVPSGPASAAKTKMGCEVGKEVWNATAGKCEAGKSKYNKIA